MSAISTFPMSRCTASSYTAHSMDEVASILGVKRNALFAFLRTQGVLRSDDRARNIPFARYSARGYFVVQLVSIQRTAGVMNVTQPLVTAKGIQYIARLIREKGVALS